MENVEPYDHHSSFNSSLSEEKFRDIVDANPGMIWTTDPEGNCNYISKKWADFTGKNQVGDLDNIWLEALHSDDRKTSFQLFLRSQENQVPYYAEYRLRRFDGEFRWVMDQGDPNYDRRGNFLGFVGMVVDIHDKKMMELKLLDALKSRDEFLSIASHELKTPLTSLKLQSQIFARAAKKGVASIYEKGHIHQLIDQTNNQVNRLNRLVDDMLDVSRIRTGKLTLIREPFDLCDLTRELLERLQDQLVSADYEAPVVKYCEGACGEWDRMRIEQVVTNLLTNAIRYGDGKPLHITIDTDEHSVRFSIQDHGIGIDQKHKDKIFNRFERAMTSEIKAWV